nr:MAG: hypothetical protein [Bacteriophage sp.]
MRSPMVPYAQKIKNRIEGQGILNIIIVSKNEETEKLYLKCIKGRLKINKHKIKFSDKSNLDKVDPKRTIFLLCGPWWENEIIECEKFRELIKTSLWSYSLNDVGL